MTQEQYQAIRQTIEAGPFAATWDSLEAYAVPDWYIDGKFGIFIHWGPYCVPAFGNEWYPRNMYLPGSKEYAHHRATYGPQDQFGYKDFIPQFTAEKYDPGAWASLFKEAGARFVVPVAEHHDGFQMYASELSRWNAAEMGPKRDLMGDLAGAVREAGMVFGVSSHRAEHWWFMNGGNTFPSDVQDPAYADFYGPARGELGQRPYEQYYDNPPDQTFLEDWLLRTCELIDKYQPQLIWFDWWIQNMAFKPYLKQFAAYYYNSAAAWGKGVAVNNKFDAFPAGTTVFDIERGQESRIRGLFWQNDTSVSKNSWGYIDNHDYKVANDIIGDLIDVVSKNGALLLNVGPRADGTIPEIEQQMLREIGAWLGVNGQAIYNTRPWFIHGEGPTKVLSGAFTDTARTPFTSQDIRFTRQGDTLYAAVMAWPEDGQVALRALGSAAPYHLAAVNSIEKLGDAGVVTWQAREDALVVDVSGCAPTSSPFVLKIVG
ncbi:MAG: alpha-L-fucosidase [Caldilineaceae bacterium]|nr:alpha-L-fucosidase [Caldilineaceae bacterium]